MKNFNHKIIIFYFLSYVTLILGLILNEDFAFGYIRDYELHLKVTNIFDNGFINGLLNYEEKKVPHSPIYLYYFTLLHDLFKNDLIAKIINIHICLLIPIYIFKSLKIKYENNLNLYIYFLPLIFFLSPYFRSGAIWIDDNLLAIVFLSISIYYFILYKKNQKLIYLFLNTLFLAIAAYVRPVYCFFSIYFFFQYFFILNSKNKFIYYIVFNILLSFPAIYYTFILDINDWFENYLFRGNLITVLSLTTSIISFYLLPYLYFYFKDKIKPSINLSEIIFILIFILSLFLFFNYNLNYSGGIYYKFSRLIFGNNILFFLISSVSILILVKFFLINKDSNKKLSDLIIIIMLIIFEFDGVIYHETYDPLIYILIFLIFDNTYIENFISSLNKYKFFILIFFSTLFYLMSVIKTFI